MGIKTMVRKSLSAETVGFGAFLATGLFLGLFDHGLPHKPAQAEIAPIAAVSSAPSLYFHGAGGELLDFAPTEQRHFLSVQASAE